MHTYTISHYEQGSWIWDGNADEHGQTTANLPDEVYDLLDRELEPGEQADVTVEGIRYRVERNDHVHCECGEVTGERCNWSGPISETVVVEYTPQHLRASHVAAGNRGNYPHNGAERLRVERSCSDVITHLWRDGEQTDDMDEWCHIVE